MFAVLTFIVLIQIMYKKYNICNSYYLNSSIYINQEISTDIKSNVLYIEFQGKRFSKWISLRKDEPDDVFINPQFRLVLQLRYTIYVQSHGGMSVCNSMLKIWHCLMLCVLIFCTFVLACWRFHGFWKKKECFLSERHVEQYRRSLSCLISPIFYSLG